MKDLVAHRTRLAGQEYVDEKVGPLDLRNARASASRWVNCTFDSTRLSSADFRGATFENCTFYKVDFQHALLPARFDRCSFERCNFDQAILQGAWFTESQIRRSRAQMSDWSDCSFYDCRVDCDFRHAKLGVAVGQNVDFRGSLLWAAHIPINCAFLAGNQFDARQVGTFLALLQQAKIPEDLKEWIKQATPERHKRLVDRILKPTSTMEPA